MVQPGSSCEQTGDERPHAGTSGKVPPCAIQAPSNDMKIFSMKCLAAMLVLAAGAFSVTAADDVINIPGFGPPAVDSNAPPAAPEPTLKMGDPAPKLTNGKWVQGDAVKKFEPGKVYVIECWATWCGPCVASIPHVNEIYGKCRTRISW